MTLPFDLQAIIGDDDVDVETYRFEIEQMPDLDQRNLKFEDVIVLEI